MNDPFQAPGADDLNRMLGTVPSASPPKDSSLVKAKGGGPGKAARDTLATRQQAKTATQEEPEREALDMTDPETASEDEPQEEEKAVLSDPAWVGEETRFHEETEVSVKVTLPEAKKTQTRLEAEMYSVTAGEPELIAKAEAYAKPDGTAVFTLPVYQPKGHESGAAKYFLVFKHKLAKALKADSLLREISEMALKSTDHALIPGLSFSKDTSFIHPRAAADLKKLESKFTEWKGKYPKGQVVVFGHADTDEKEAKALSERRAQSAFAFITNDAAAWEKLYQGEKWGLIALQILLKDLGHYGGKPDGEDGPKTQAGFKSLQKKARLPETGKEDASTRKTLFAAYMKGKHDIQLEASRFRQVAGNPWMGCAANNRAKAGNTPAPENRRVTFILINESRFFPVYFYCRDGDEKPCGHQCQREGKRSSPGIGCHFYDELVREEKQAPAADPEEQAEAGNEGAYRIEKAVGYLEANLFPKSEGACAKHVRLAILAGGVNISPNPLAAKDYDSYLIKHGFSEISKENYSPLKGDVAVIQPFPGGRPYGHITMFDGKTWLSDFAQTDMWSGPGYRKNKPPYNLYRWVEP